MKSKDLLIFLFFSLICVFLSLILLLRGVGEVHLLGVFFDIVYELLINRLWGLSYIIFPIIGLWVNFCFYYKKWGKKYIQQLDIATITLQCFYFFLLLFFFNILLLNSFVIYNSSLAGLFPKFFHAVVVNYLGDFNRPTFLSFAFELSFFVTSILLVMFVFRFYWKDKIKKINPQKLLDLNKLIASKAAKNISHALAKLFSKEKQDFFKNKIPVLKIKDNALEKVIDKKKVFLKIPKEQFNALETGQYDSIFSDENKADNLSPEQENFTPTPAVSSTEISDEETNTSDDTKLKINRFIAEGQDDTSPSDVTISKSVDEPEKSLEESENEKISDIVKTTNDNSSKEPSNNLLGNPLDSPLSSIPSLSPLPPLSSETEEDSNFIADTGTMSTSEISEVPNQSELGDIDKNTDSHNSSETNNSSKIVTTFDKIPDVLNNENEKKLNENTDKVVANIEIIHFSIPSTNNEDSDQYIREMAQKLETVLNDFSIKAKVVEVATGPVITRYEITIEKGIRLSKITGLNDNIALSLAAKSVRIIAPIPGKSSIGIEIPNKNRKMISLRDVIDTPSFWEEDKNESVLPIALGKSISGRGVIADLASTPHLLVAGATGSGKSVCVNSIICSLLFKLSPQEVRFLMIDPKMVELAVYNDIPHLLSPVIIDPKKAALALRWVIAEMESRYYLLEKHKVRSIQSYNEMVNKKLQKNIIQF